MGEVRNEKKMANFRDALKFYSLNDLGCRGNQFTWSNKYEDSTFTNEQLDRMVAIHNWS